PFITANRALRGVERLGRRHGGRKSTTCQPPRSDHLRARAAPGARPGGPYLAQSGVGSDGGAGLSAGAFAPLVPDSAGASFAGGGVSLPAPSGCAAESPAVWSLEPRSSGVELSPSSSSSVRRLPVEPDRRRRSSSASISLTMASP